MSYQKAKELLEKYRSGNCTDAEKALVEQWLFQYQPNKFDLSEERIEEIGQEIWSNLPKPAAKVIKSNLWLKVAAAAIVLIFLSVGSYLLFFGKEITNYSVVYKHDVAPGSNKAILTLANGKNIVLENAPSGRVTNEGQALINKADDGKLVYHNNDSTSKTPAYNTLTTPRGGQYLLVLADGTRAWLNAASSIKYPAFFAGNERKVEITGEVYFEVAHNAAKPFKVIVNQQTIEVLGTHFNVNAYTDEPATKTSLLEGKVKVTHLDKTALLVPGEQAQVNNSMASANINVVEQVDMDEVLAWKSGLFQFNKASIESILRQVGRWYNVEISYSNNQKPLKTFTGSISRSSSLAQLLQILSYTGNSFEIDGKKIIVKSE
ncbi:FecR family protein [Mucilaginibacter aquaedulcis]|uniref:FecR family protein n=1 Tax=Mucilaginibacter aquaedulcis TaxID=1187081 RepID=UPI0025B5F6B8|nr:FecR family protein [Mucilaginibacter aquaedulcis]MDN3548663.1 FecR domain-containing protein [Mucilaginibacter aquaedulcis]